MGSLLGSIFGGNAQKKAAKTAAQAEIQAQEMAIAASREAQQRQEQLSKPTSLMGAQARARQMLMQGYSVDDAEAYLNQTAQAWGVPRTALGAPLAGVDGQALLQNNPAYQVRLNESQKALERSAAARGKLFSGATGQALGRDAQDHASNEWEAIYGREGQLAGDGQAATDRTSENIGELGRAISGARVAQGDSRASSYLARGNIAASQWGAVGGALDKIVGMGGGFKLPSSLGGALRL